ncbi:hypothetical protein Tco_0052245 [Tanacetum coccineum]
MEGPQAMYYHRGISFVAWLPLSACITMEPTGRLIPLGGQCPLVRPTALNHGPQLQLGIQFFKLSVVVFVQMQVIQIFLWYLDLGCSKHMTGDRSRLRNFVKKFIETVRFGNDHFAAIMGYGDYVIGDSVISRFKQHLQFTIMVLSLSSEDLLKLNLSITKLLQPYPGLQHRLLPLELSSSISVALLLIIPLVFSDCSSLVYLPLRPFMVHVLFLLVILETSS